MKKHIISLIISVFVGSYALAQVPVINSFSPVTGVVGSTVTISGSGFDGTSPANNQVFFGSAQATVLSSSFGTLTVAVPAGSTSTLISVRNATTKLIGYSRNHYNAIFCSTPLTTTTYNTYNQQLGGIYGAYNIDIYDMDGDGKSDIITGNNSNGITVARNGSSIGSMNFSATNLNPGNNVQQFFVADFDGDGKRDIIFGGGNGAYLYPNTSTPGSISFGSKITVSNTIAFYQCAAGDFNNDGKIDFIGGTNNGTNQLATYRNTSTGPGNFGFAANTVIPSTNIDVLTRGLQCVDLDGDGVTDIVGTALDNNSVFTIRNVTSAGNTTFSFAATQSISCPGSPYRLKLGDFDKDGKIDLVTPLYTSSQTGFFRNTSTIGSISFSSLITFPAVIQNYRVGVGDVNGDGLPDVVTKPNGVGTIFQVYMNTSSGAGNINFNNPITYSSAAGSEVGGIAIGDMDGDLVPDIATSGVSTNVIRFHRNTSAQADNTPPTAVCKNITVALSPSGTVTVTGAMINGGSTDACGIGAFLINGQASQTYTCSDIGANNATLTVKDFAGNTTNCSAVVTVAPAAIIVAGQTTVCQGQTVLLTANAGDSYQWQLNGSNISGATNQTYAAATTGNYTVIVTNAGGCSGTSAAAAITVNTNPTVNVTPSGSTFLCPPANNAVLTASTSSIYQWTLNGSNISGATQQSYTVTAAGSYSVSVVDGFGCSATSNAVVVTNTPPEINIRGNGNSIANGDASPSAGDNTDFGSTYPSVPVTKSFTIENTGSGPLLVTSLSMGGANAANFTVGGISTPTSIAAGSSASFTVTFNGTSLQTYGAKLTVNSVECDESEYKFMLAAEISCQPAAYTNFPSNMSLNNQAGQCTAVATYTVAASGAPNPNLSYTFSGATSGSGSGTGSGSSFNLGTTTVTINASNVCSSQNASFTITVVDNQAPVLNTADNKSLNAISGGCTANYTIADPISDNCSGSSWSYVLTGATTGSGSGIADGTSSGALSFNKGVTTVTVDGVDAAANAATQTSFTVTVSDNEDPSLSNAGNQSLNTITGTCAANYTIADPISDNCSGSSWSYVLTGATTGSGSGIADGTSSGALSFNKGVTTVTIDGEDAATNAATQTSFTVTVSDNENPVLSNAGNQSLNTITGTCAANYTIADPISDNCSGSSWSYVLTGATTGSGSGIADGTGSGVISFNKGTTTVTLSGVDAATNAATSESFTVTVSDNENPVLSNAGNQSLNTITGTCAANYTIADPISDNCSGSTWSYALTGATTGSGSGIADGTGSGVISFNKGTTTVTLTGVDASSNAATSESFTVTVSDNENPVLSNAGNQSLNTITGSCAANYTIADPISDNCSGSTWSYALTGATTGSGSGIADGTGSGVISFNKGVTTVMINGVDASTNAATSESFTVTVSDNENPVLSNAGNQSLNTITGTCAANYTIADPISDNCSGSSWSYALTGATTGSGSGIADGSGSGVISFNTGMTTVTLNGVDASTNAATSESFTVTVSDNENPVAKTKNISVTLVNGTASITAANVNNNSTDNCGIQTMSVSPNSFTCANIGNNTVTLTTTDANGNSHSNTAMVNVIGNIPTVNITESLLPMFCQASVKTLTANTTTNIVTYAWSNGASAMKTNVGTTGTYYVTVTNNYGCTASNSKTTTIIASNLLSSYTIIGIEKVRIEKNSYVQSGGVGADATIAKKNKKSRIEVEDSSTITGSSTFARALEIDVKNNSTVTTQFLDSMTVSLPDFKYNPFKNNQGNNVNVSNGSTVTLNDSIYKEVKLGTGSTIIFTSPVLYLKKIEANSNATIKFLNCAVVKIDDKLDLGKNNSFNPDGNSIAVYVEKHVDVDEGSNVKGVIYALDHFDTKGKDNNRITMTGQFIGKEFHSHYTTWNWNTNCSGCNFNKTGVVLAETTADAFLKEGEVQLNVFPNPSEGQFTVDINSMLKGNLKLTIYNPLGQVMKTIQDPDFDGMTSIGVDMKNRGSSYYMLKVELPGATMTRKVLIVK